MHRIQVAGMAHFPSNVPSFAISTYQDVQKSGFCQPHANFTTCQRKGFFPPEEVCPFVLQLCKYCTVPGCLHQHIRNLKNDYQQISSFKNIVFDKISQEMRESSKKII